MRIYPAIDLLGGKVVRLHQGDYEAVTSYDDDARAVAERFRRAVDVLHVVDLEGARLGAPAQRERVREVIAAFEGGTVQVGGGVRSREALEAYLELGARRVILGTAAVRDPAFVRDLAHQYPGVVVLAVDARGGFVATDGWTETSRVHAVDLVRALAGAPLAAVLYTDVARDGTAAGPNVDATTALADASPFPVLASGGVGALEDLEVLAQITNVEGAVVGRALYEGRFSLEEAVAAARTKAGSAAS